MEDIISTLSGWTGEHSLQYLESPIVKDFTFDCSVTNSSDVENNMRKDSISTLSEWTGEHSRQYLESPSSEDVMKDFMYDSLYKIMTAQTHYLT